MVLAKWMWEGAIYFPFIVLLFSYWFFNHPDSTTTFQTAADVTTPFFMLGVIRALQTIEQQNSMTIVVSICVVVAVVMMVLERFIQKKFFTFAVIKRIWRVYFLIFTMLYCGIWIFLGIHTVWYWIQ